MALGRTVVEWTGGRLVWEREGERRSRVPEETEWRRLRRAADTAGVWDWRDRYEQPAVAEGRIRLVELLSDGRRVASSGADGYPGPVRAAGRPTPGWRRFFAAVEELAGAPVWDRGARG